MRLCSRSKSLVNIDGKTVQTVIKHEPLSINEVAEGSLVDVKELPPGTDPLYAFYYSVEPDGIKVEGHKVQMLGQRACTGIKGGVYLEWCSLIYDSESGLTPADEILNYVGQGTAKEPSAEIKEQAMSLALLNGDIEAPESGLYS